MAFFSLADDDVSLFVSKTEKAEAKTLGHNDTLDNLVSLDCGSEFEESDLDLQEIFEATAFSQKPFITYSSKLIEAGTGFRYIPVNLQWNMQ